MPEYQVFARKYRPQFFKDVIGQDPIVKTLVLAIQNKRLAHAYLFSGPHGTGKTSLARLFAKAINCKQRSKEGEPCNECSSCLDISRGHSLDVLEIDGASHRGIEDIRKINETLGYVSSAPFKIYLIDEVHMLTKEAFNALLKSLEEPPSHVKFFFATTEPHLIPQTILSRCQRYNLKRISEEKIREKLHKIGKENGCEIESEALQILSQMAEGGLRDAESLFDELISFEGKKITAKGAQTLFGLTDESLFLQLDESALKNDFNAAFTIVQNLFSSGKNIAFLLDALLNHFRAHLREERGVFTKEVLLNILEILIDAGTEIKQAPSKRAFLELLFLRIINAPKKLSLATLVARLEELESRLDGREEIPKKEVVVAKPQEEKKELVNEKSRYDTLTRFAAQELKGSLR